MTNQTFEVRVLIRGTGPNARLDIYGSHEAILALREFVPADQFIADGFHLGTEFPRANLCIAMPGQEPEKESVP